ncbi:UvrD-helicase domain-containing protein [Bacillus litorisediminis]|uniref:UvrD-helicase domain-containing protein n=1 Tax=Bacillus litorisediminis TaxID=2922713 RepID=UPI001FAE4E2C|nr:ATP-dependent helicase [Bacillus litorisediminis]
MYNSLSDLQKKIVFDMDGKSVVRACPGSGKTHSISAKFAHIYQNWKSRHSGIAVISFTNVAWKEIEKKINANFGVKTPIEYPHFLGTIDSFINKYIFLPFGHHIMGCSVRPTLVGEPHGNWTSGKYEKDYNKYFDKTSFNINDELVPTTNMQQFHFKWKKKDGSLSGHVKHVEQVKKKYWLMGYATQDDANYISLKLLERYPSIAKSIVYRFPQFIIDEAQDTSEIQMKIIDILLSNGLENIMLVGDPDQAIFEWNDARPELFIQKFNEWEENSLILNENWRSSAKICNFTYSLSSLENPSIAVNDDVKDINIDPIIQIYDENSLNKIIDYFLELCKMHHIEINEENVAVIYRSKSIYHQIMGESYVQSLDAPWLTGHMVARELALGKYIYDNIDPREGFKIIEKALYKIFFGTDYCSQSNLEELTEKIGFTKYRKRIINIISILPNTNCSVSDWIAQTINTFKDKRFKTTLKINKDKGNILLDTLFNPFHNVKKLNFRTGTVHTTKGETFEAVLLLLKQRGATGSFYKRLLNHGLRTTDSEELRIVYVGMTRPRRLLVLGVPNEEDKEAWIKRMQTNP